MAKLTKAQENYISIMFNEYCDKIKKSTKDGEIFKLCRNFLTEIKDAEIEIDGKQKFYFEFKKVRDERNL